MFRHGVSRLQALPCQPVYGRALCYHNIFYITEDLLILVERDAWEQVMNGVVILEPPGESNKLAPALGRDNCRGIEVAAHTFVRRVDDIGKQKHQQHDTADTAEDEQY